MVRLKVRFCKSQTLQDSQMTRNQLIEHTVLLNNHTYYRVLLPPLDSLFVQTIQLHWVTNYNSPTSSNTGHQPILLPSATVHHLYTQHYIGAVIRDLPSKELAHATGRVRTPERDCGFALNGKPCAQPLPAACCRNMNEAEAPACPLKCRAWVAATAFPFHSHF